MNGFLYFVPTDSKAADPAALLTSAGLGHVLDAGSEPLTTRAMAQGPGGAAGLMVGTADDAPAYDPATQTWRRGRRFHVGLRHDRPRPGPADLARRKIYPGEALALDDGNLWIVPRCHGWLAGRPTVFPRVMDLADDGDTPILGDVVPSFAAIAADARRVLNLWAQQPDAEELTGPQEIRIATAAMAVNYRVALLELAMLELLNNFNLRDILLATCDALEAVRQIHARQDAAKQDAARQA